MIACGDVQPPDIHRTLELARDFEVFRASYEQRMKGGQPCGTFTHAFIAWLICREHMRAEFVAAMRSESERAVAMFNSPPKD